MMTFRILIAALAFWFPLAAHAEMLPALFDVRNVASDDRLNIRAAPTGASEKVGALSHSAKGIEVIRLNPSGKWGMVNAGESSGWVAMRFMKRQHGQWPGGVPEIRSCFGTEPFWDLGMQTDGSIRLSTPVQDHFGTVVSRATASGRLDAFAYDIEFHGATTASGTAVIRARACNDGMSDREFGLSLDLVISRPGNLQMLSGCCSLSR